MRLSKVVFKPDELKDATKDFEGQVIDAEYGENPFGFEGREDIERRAQLAIKIRTEEYEKEQFEWYPPSDKKLTKSAQAVVTPKGVVKRVCLNEGGNTDGVGWADWAYFIKAMQKCGALKDTVVKGKTDDERMTSFAKSLIGMNFRFVEYTNLPCIVQDKTLRIILPEEYKGRTAVEETGEVRSEEVSPLD